MEKGTAEPFLERIAGLLKFSRMDLAVLPFIFAGLGAAFITAMGAMAFGYDSRPLDVRRFISYSSLLLIFPAFLVAMLQRRWASLPLWVCSVVLIAPAFLHPKEMIEAANLRGELQLLTVLLLTEAARLIRGKKPEEQA
jgi:hypothetical protein